MFIGSETVTKASSGYRPVGSGGTPFKMRGAVVLSQAVIAR
jgi:hypothetical protein